jgi:Protein of unknown function (DUF2817)
MSQGYFSETYPEARAKFHEFAGKVHARMSSFVLPSARGAAGEALAMDVAWLGSDAPRAAVVVTSGTHGAEGYAGSGFQCSFLAERAATVLRPGVVVVLVHALNPFGFSHVCRVNEQNVDLNRNFIDFSRPPAVSRGYERLHSAIVPREWTGEVRMRADRSIEDAWVALGERGFQQTVCRGQYTHADGLFYGGSAPSWSNIVWREYLAGLPRSIELLAHIDIHTGLGPFGYGEIVYSLPTGEHALVLASQWYQDLEFRTAGSRESAATPIGGTMNHAVIAAEIAETTSISLEFGTVGFRRMFEALRAENWLRVCAPAGLPDEAQIRKELVSCFYPSDTGWRDAVVERCNQVLTRTIACVDERLKARRHAPNGK